MTGHSEPPHQVADPRAVNLAAGIATETTPLLASDIEADAGDVGNGSAAAGEAADSEEESREGLPEVAARMHLILPALGIGVSWYREDERVAIDKLWRCCEVGGHFLT